MTEIKKGCATCEHALIAGRTICTKIGNGKSSPKEGFGATCMLYKQGKPKQEAAASGGDFDDDIPFAPVFDKF